MLLGVQGLLFLMPASLVAIWAYQLGGDILGVPEIMNYVLRQVAPGLVEATLAAYPASGLFSLRPRMPTLVLVLEPAFVLLGFFHLGGNPLINTPAWGVLILLFTPKLKQAFASSGDQSAV